MDDLILTPSEQAALGLLLLRLPLGEDSIGEILKTGGFHLLEDNGHAVVDLALKLDKCKNEAKTTVSRITGKIVTW